MSKGAGHAMCLLSKDNTGLSALRLCHTHRETSQPHRRLMHKSTRTYYTTCPKHKQCMMGRLTKTPHRSWVSATFIEKDSFRDHSLRARLFKKPCWGMEKNTDSPVKVQSYLMLLDSFPLAKYSHFNRGNYPLQEFNILRFCSYSNLYAFLYSKRHSTHNNGCLLQLTNSKIRLAMARTEWKKYLPTLQLCVKWKSSE